MKNASLAISANGTTIYELAASHVPTISFSLVTEQVNSAKALSSLGVVKYAGEMFSNMEECLNTIIYYVQNLQSNPLALMQLGKNAHHVIAGNGCEKIFNVVSTL